ncbi:hypothetical protein DL98DRAFT_525738 [Cadophora sp. DSE1049]|nr:hypothetical protein DL98DRAFT_525738 [Cadophora sp. DSE1049]
MTEIKYKKGMMSSLLTLAINQLFRSNTEQSSHTPSTPTLVLTSNFQHLQLTEHQSSRLLDFNNSANFKMQFSTSDILVLMPFMASLVIAAPIAGPGNAVSARSVLPEACHFLNDDISTKQLVCKYTSTDANAKPVVSSNIAGICGPDPTGDFDMTCKLVCDDTGCHYTTLEARDLEADAYSLSVAIVLGDDASSAEKREVAIDDEAYMFVIPPILLDAPSAEKRAAAEEEAYKFSVTIVLDTPAVEARDVVAEEEAYGFSITIVL